MSARKTSLNTLLRRDDPFQTETAADGPHVSEEQMRACLSGAGSLSPEQRRHLASCFECRSEFGNLSEARRAERGPWARRVTYAALPIALAASAVVLLAVTRPGTRGDVDVSAWRARSGEVGAEADVTLVRTRGAGRESLRDGGTVRRGDRIGFFYGNLEGTYQTLSVLTSNEGKIQWYAPASTSGAPIQIARGPEARSVRLPMEILLDATDRLGELLVVAAFDTPGPELERWLRAGTPEPPPAGARVFRLILEAPDGD